MPDDPAATNTLRPDGSARSTDVGDVPDALRRRYLTKRARWGGGLAYYADATIVAPSFRDRGRELVAIRSDPNTVRDLVAIAEHRGWMRAQVRGAAGFRRQVWLAGRIAGLEVDGYRPTERDRQDLARHLERRTRRHNPAPARAPAPETSRPQGRPAATAAGPTAEDWQDLARRLAARTGRPGPDLAQAPGTVQRRGRQKMEAPGPSERMRIVETVLRDRVADPDARARIFDTARRRIAELLERGARFYRLQARETRRRAPERQR
ncbi:LPD7 domain-containing protein [Phenylobacterium sp.]|jgi:hypothetical protein|uniref:LPD7 domain-containing protein n=1 Tax=Phenylobacterium sp. TaxID=1871053 RepID=UPI002E309D72|nr:LPD7 domain-containing protein [Phenylobacterium sp.]HEX3365000.1 LPD7 domain-containing protein [Phenylobacterium sp.]